MDIIIQSLGFKAGESLETFVNEKLGTIKNDRIIRANVTLFKGPLSESENDYCEIRLEMPGQDPFVKRHSAHFETAVSECVDVLSETLSRLKSRDLSQRQAQASAIEDAMMNADTDDDTELEDVVKSA